MDGCGNGVCVGAGVCVCVVGVGMVGADMWGCMLVLCW